MNPNSSETTLRELRSDFLRESKLFCKALENDAIENAAERDQVLNEMRQRLKVLLELINDMEKKDLTKSI